MKKLDLKTPDLTTANVEKLAALFPNCATETRDAEGNVKRAIDFDLLRQELSGDLVEGPQERYRLDWPGKREALALANAPIDKTLRPCRDESVDFETTQNLYIEGDNLDALKLLQETYLGKVKMIYIDPPYNTGNDFIYDDNFSISREDYQEKSGEVDEEGNAMFDEEKWKQNASTNGRFHSEWLSMMYPRLKLARNLLREDGVIFISIDDNEVKNLKSICDEIFGVDNFLSQLVWKKKYIGGKHAKHFVDFHEYILVYTRDSNAVGEFLIDRPDTEKEKFKYTDEYEYDRGKFYARPLKSNLGLRKTLIYSIKCPDGSSVNNQWMVAEDTYFNLVKEGRILFKVGRNGKSQVYRKFYERDGLGKVKVPSLIDDVANANGKVEIKELFRISEGRDIPFENPKPVGLLKHLLVPSTEEADLILDFFAGSCTTAHAVMQLNAEDGGNRRSIMVQLPEPCGNKSEAFKAGYTTIAEIGKERIRRAGAKVLAEWQGGQVKQDNGKSGQGDFLDPLSTISGPSSPPDTGFRVLKIDSPSRAAVFQRPGDLKQDELGIHVDNLKPDRSDEDLLFQVMLDWGVDFGLPIREETLAGKKVFFVAENSLAACFAHGVDDTLIRELAKREPVRVVFRDSGFASDAAKINAGQLFKALSPHTDLKTL